MNHFSCSTQQQIKDMTNGFCVICDKIPEEPKYIELYSILQNNRYYQKFTQFKHLTIEQFLPIGKHCDNGVYLCKECSKKIDKEYSIEYLKILRALRMNQHWNKVSIDNYNLRFQIAQNLTCRINTATQKEFQKNIFEWFMKLEDLELNFSHWLEFIYFILFHDSASLDPLFINMVIRHFIPKYQQNNQIIHDPKKQTILSILINNLAKSCSHYLIQKIAEFGEKYISDYLTETFYYLYGYHDLYKISNDQQKLQITSLFKYPFHQLNWIETDKYNITSLIKEKFENVKDI